MVWGGGVVGGLIASLRDVGVGPNTIENCVNFTLSPSILARNASLKLKFG